MKQFWLIEFWLIESLQEDCLFRYNYCMLDAPDYAAAERKAREDFHIERIWKITPLAIPDEVVRWREAYRV